MTKSSQQLHAAYRRAVDKAIREASVVVCGSPLSASVLREFKMGCRTDGSRWAARGRRRKLAITLSRAGLLEPGSLFHWTLFRNTLTEGVVTPKGRHLLWLIYEAFRDNRHLFVAGQRRKYEEAGRVYHE